MINIKNLSFFYKKSRPLFNDFSLEVENGSIVGLLGKNGAGKSTLLNLFAGLLPAKNGLIEINGFAPFERKPAFLADISVIPEEFSLPQIKISTYIRAIAPLYPNFDMQKLDKILSDFELQKSDKLHKLSHGQRKKFLIAFTLATNCKLLLLDEPTNGLDIPSKSQFRKVIAGSVSDEQIVVISTHQVRDIEQIIDKIIVVDNGKTIFSGSVENVGKNYLFKSVNALKSDDNVLYSEKNLDGYRVVMENQNNTETGLDLELFFNFLINNK